MTAADRPTPPGLDSLAIAIVGLGRVGAALGQALDSIGHTITAISAPRSAASSQWQHDILPDAPRLSPAETAQNGDVVFLCVPDDVLPTLCADLADSWRPGQIVLHTSGRHGLAALASATAAGALPVAVHPAMTFTGLGLDITRLQGCRFAVTANALVQPLACALVQSLGGVPVVVADEHRVAYHAALTHSANYLVTLVSQAQQIFTDCGLGQDAQELMTPLLQAALANALENGFQAITGPISRGDVATVKDHVAVLADTAPDIPASYRALGRATTQRALQTGQISTTAAQKLFSALQDTVEPQLR